jgi:hypothetical protein
MVGERERLSLKLGDDRVCMTRLAEGSSLAANILSAGVRSGPFEGAEGADATGLAEEGVPGDAAGIEDVVVASVVSQK